MPATTTSESSTKYSLSLHPPKGNVFVTQLNDREDNDDIRKFPIVKESADKLLQSGVNTLQSTSLLRQAIDVEHVDRDLAEKREEFRRRMEVCKAKEQELRARRQKMNERVLKFDKFLKENEAKRNRALKKYQHEVRENENKCRDLVKLNVELEDLNYHRDLLKKRGLVDRNSTIQTSIEDGQKELDDLKQEFNKQKLIFNSQLASLQNKKEKLTESNGILEQRAAMNHQKMCTLMSKLGQVLMGIDNLASQSHRRHWPPLAEMSYTQKLNMVQEYLLERIAVEEMVRHMMAEAEIRSSSGHTIYQHGKSIPSVAVDAPTPESAFSRKHHQPLPAIQQHGKRAGPENDRIRHFKTGGNFLERLSAISEI